MLDQSEESNCVTPALSSQGSWLWVTNMCLGIHWALYIHNL